MRANKMRLGLLFCFAFFILTIPTAAQISHLGPPKHPGHEEGEAPGGEPSNFTPQALGPTSCFNGFADAYPCSNIDLESFMTLTDLGADPGERGAGIWGWTDPETRREYALVALRNRVSFVDITDPKNPRLVGDLPGTATGTPNREVNVLGDLALVVADGAGSNGVQYFDLKQLRGTSGPPQHFTASGGLVTGSGRIHNIAVNAETGFAYAVGGDCGGGLEMIDVRNNFKVAGCWADPARAYIHDTQCAIYRGPDRRFTGRELCFASAVDALLIVDVTDKSAPQKISRTSYEGVGFTHQGWLTEDHKYFLMDDEFDEADGGNTRTYLWNLSDLTAPRMFAVHQHSTRSIDHNLYVRGNRVYQSNYRAGLHILDISRIAEGTLKEVGFFDIVPDRDDAGFDGAWGNYPFFPSGTVVVSGINQGLYILKPQPVASEPKSCKPGPDRLCFQGNRFLVNAGWRNATTGATGKGTVLKRGPNFGIFSLGSGQADLLVRMTKTGQEVRLLYGQLTNLQISVGVTDTKKGGTTRFSNGPNNCGAVQPIPGALTAGITLEAEDDLFDLLNPHTFDFVKSGAGISEELDLASQPLTLTDHHETGTCKASPTRLCLHDKRFQAELTWRDPATGATGTAKATKITDSSGTFAFKAANGVDVAVKAVETDRARIFWGSLTSFEYTLKVTDTLSRQVKTYTNPAGVFCGGVDEEGF